MPRPRRGSGTKAGKFWMCAALPGAFVSTAEEQPATAARGCWRKKRYSLAVGPPKKVPKVKGVESAAVQAFLKRQEEEKRKKALEERRKKEELLAKRIELKHDRKARAMASRTKDNFYGYNGIPIEEKFKKKRSCENITQAPEAEYATEDDTEQLEYSQTESEHEQEEHEEKPSKLAVKPKAPPKSAPAPLNFAELLRLAEKKQYEPVEIKVVKKVEERPRTAEELREREYLGRKNKRVDMHKKSEKEIKSTGLSSSSKKVTSHKESVNAKLNRSSMDKHSALKGSLLSTSGTDRKSKAPALAEKHLRSSSSSRIDQMEKASQNGSLKSSTGGNHSKLPVNGTGKSGSSSQVPPSKPAANGAQRIPSAKESSLKKSAHAKSGSASALQHGINSNAKRSGSSLGKGGPGHPGGRSGAGPGRPSSNAGVGPGRPGSSSSLGPERLGSGSGMGPGRLAGSSSTGLGRLGSSLSTGPGRPGISTNARPGRPGSSVGTGPGRPGVDPSTGSGRPGSGLGTGPGRPGICPSTGAKRPGSSLGTGPGRPGINPSTGPGRPGSGLGTTVKPKCTVVSETISSKNLVTRPSNGQINGMRSFQGHRPAFHPQGLGRPPINYKRQIEDDDDDEYDSEMDDFIEDEGEPQEEISKHIREIFGYDRKRYKDESDYALRYMESSWREQQKEEARSLRLGVQEDLEELRREEEELKRKRQSKKLRTR
ncbi:protein SPT2 homolog isoform X1 [Falco biarmicus]|uniref:protein SPT2 homolog isoform X1 n=1 Tax=Falco rusticolus TaxID=120794 RepID=UPI0006B75228|nr:protein SPT2 homolog isoform X1 [Falco rusticolus]XP_055578294.1 protein SPT2 homolog isoform X1 [Falco cherrug]XP_056210048.1 protein SPT2 homolog isoform X1 [Falco biarmicus]